MDDKIINQKYLKNSDISPVHNIYKVCKGTVKIVLENGDQGSGFFLKFQRNNKLFYCIMTNQHVIGNINKEKKITIIYDNKIKELSIILNPKERFIQSFNLLEEINTDITIVEIIEKDNIDDSFFLLPNIQEPKEFCQKAIQIIQYPKGNILSFSEGKIEEICVLNNNMFLHNSSTEFGSSGSPIVLKGKEEVFAIHKGALKNKKVNVGIFIKNIIEYLKCYKKNGEGIEYYKNGKIKYEGYFYNDEYHDDNGKFYYENGDIYIGQFKYGRKCGNGCIINENMLIKEIKDNSITIDNSKNNKDAIWDSICELKRQTVQVFMPLGKLFNIKCNRCKHSAKSHAYLMDKVLECSDCPLDDNICMGKQILAKQLYQTST